MADTTDQTAVDFFGERLVHAARAQARFHMTHGYLQKCCSQCTHGSAAGVAMHQGSCGFAAESCVPMADISSLARAGRVGTCA